MKKFLILTSILFAVPAFAACPIDGITSSCSIADAVKFPSTGIDRGLNTNVGSTSPNTLRVPELSQPKRPQSYNSIPNRNSELESRSYTENNPLRDFRQTKQDFSYNAGCQFGACNQTGTPQLFQQRGK